MAASPVVLSSADVERLLDLPTCIDAVEDAFRRRAQGAATPSGVLGVHVPGGGFHVKAAALTRGRAYFAAKINANFPDNPARRGIDGEPVAEFAHAARRSAMIITCTPSRQAFLGVDHVRPGSFIGAVGADNEHKQEVAPSLMRAAAVVVDDLDQCATIGDLH